MKVLLILAVATLASCADKTEKRSVGHYDGWTGIGYHAPITTYTTARELPSYIVPESTSVTTASQKVYKVQVPVTYTHTIAQPVVKHTTTYQVPSYNYQRYYQAPAYHAPVYSSYVAPSTYPVTYTAPIIRQPSTYTYSYAPSYAPAWSR